MATAIEKTDVATKEHTAAAAKAASKMHRRSRSGCFTCRVRRKKCEEGKPKCKACRHLGLSCEYKRPDWWSNADTRNKQKDLIKSVIKRTKTNEKSSQSGSKHGSIHLHHMGSGASSPDSEEYDNFDQFPAGTPGLYDPYCMPMYSGNITQTPVQYSSFHPYEVDVKTERQMFVNDVPTRRDSSISTFSTWVPPPDAMVQPYIGNGDEWATTTAATHHHHSSDSYYMSQLPSQLNTDLDDLSHEEDLDFNFFQYSHPHPHPQPHQQHPLPSTQLPRKTEVTADVSAQIPLDDVDRPLFSYMLSHVLPLLYPILNANQHGSVRSDILLPALENNKAYLHSCLTAAATHQRAALDMPGAPSVTEADLAAIDDSIVRHKYSFVQEVVTALTNDTHHVEILEATLGMISFSTCVGRAPPSTLPPPSHTLPSPTLDDHNISPITGAAATAADIPWHSHFQAATELVTKLLLPTHLESMTGAHSSPPFNMTLTAWIDILGSTMLGRSPTFANTYRTKHLSGSSSGLAELMGCHDGVMYLLSEIACLESLQRDGKLDDHAICQHVASLGEQLNATESTTSLDDATGLPVTVPLAPPTSPFSRSGALRPRQLSKNITAIFQKAARVYLCSLVPAYQKSQPATCALIDQMADLLQFIPSGPQGFDRSLVWPYLICGANSVPSSRFRRVLAERIELMNGDEDGYGGLAEMGSFGKMVRLLHEVWRVGDEALLQGVGCEGTPVTVTGGSSPLVGAGNVQGSSGGSSIMGTPMMGAIGIGVAALAPQQQSTTTTMTTTTTTPMLKSHHIVAQQNVHWRDVMQMNGWDFLLI